MRYPAIITHDEAGFIVASFPDLPGCQTQAPAGGDIEGRARAALTGWLAMRQGRGEDLPLPGTIPAGAGTLWVEADKETLLREIEHERAWNAGSMAAKRDLLQHVLALHEGLRVTRHEQSKRESERAHAHIQGEMSALENILDLLTSEIG